MALTASTTDPHFLAIVVAGGTIVLLGLFFLVAHLVAVYQRHVELNSDLILTQDPIKFIDEAGSEATVTSNQQRLVNSYFGGVWVHPHRFEESVSEAEKMRKVNKGNLYADRRILSSETMGAINQGGEKLEEPKKMESRVKRVEWKTGPVLAGLVCEYDLNGAFVSLAREGRLRKVEPSDEEIGIRYEETPVPVLETKVRRALSRVRGISIAKRALPWARCLDEGSSTSRIAHFVALVLEGSRTKTSTSHVLYRIPGSVGAIRNLEEVNASLRFPLHPRIRNSLVADLATAVGFLHNNLRSAHGEISPTMCLVDHRWRLSLAGFGLSRALGSARKSGDKERQYCAPEILRSYGSTGNGTLPGDIYSLAMVGFSILIHEQPFEGFGSLETVLEKIAEDKEGKFRPNIPKDLDERQQQLLADCWAQNPLQRLNSSDLLERLRSFDSTLPAFASKSASEDSLAWLHHADMSQYIRELEVSQIKLSEKGAAAATTQAAIREYKVQVYELQQQIEEARRRNEEAEAEKMDIAARSRRESLVAEMRAKTALLPKPLQHAATTGVAYGITPSLGKPTTYEAITILVCSIAGFSKLNARFQDTPATLFELLNRYQEAVDSIVGRFAKVHVLEKLCDTYVICSGAPDANEYHGSDIADVAFRMFEHFANRDVGYLVGGDEKIELRIGIHTGSTVGGVIGDPPKFIVMGETPNLASRIEALCQPGEVLVSDTTKAILTAANKSTSNTLQQSQPQPLTSMSAAATNHPGRPYFYDFESRGEVDLRARGRLGLWSLTAVVRSNVRTAMPLSMTGISKTSIGSVYSPVENPVYLSYVSPAESFPPASPT
ncbi:hypothetical protein BJ742DRAFT_320840 [Cladochytrium replicatum]|nr:hypothetical protein BJ742DRAFT_320840 [Cladochytrium replicatum]